MDMIARLRAERHDLVARLDEIDKILTQYELIERAAQQLLGDRLPADSATVTAESVEHVAPPTPVVSTDRTVRGKNKTPIEDFEQAVVDVLKDAAAPMDRVALYDALTGRGIVIGDGDRDKELNALSARVYRMAQAGRLTNRRGQGYSLPEEAEGGEAPATPQEPTTDYNAVQGPVLDADDLTAETRS